LPEATAFNGAIPSSDDGLGSAKVFA
jgi:hypothetical protein